MTKSVITTCHVSECVFNTFIKVSISFSVQCIDDRELFVIFRKDVVQHFYN